MGAKPQRAESAWASLILPCLDHKQVGSDDPTVATPDSGQYPPVVRAREVIELRPPPRPGVGLEQQAFRRVTSSAEPYSNMASTLVLRTIRTGSESEQASCDPVVAVVT